MQNRIIIIILFIGSTFSLQGQVLDTTINNKLDSNVYISNIPPVILKYSSAWVISRDEGGGLDLPSRSDIKPRALLSLTTDPTSEVPSVVTRFILMVDSSYNKSTITDETIYLNYLKTKMLEEYPFKFEDKLFETTIGGTSFITLTSYSFMMGYFIQMDFSIKLFKGNYILIMSIFDNEDDKRKFSELYTSFQVGNKEK